MNQITVLVSWIKDQHSDYKTYVGDTTIENELLSICLVNRRIIDLNEYANLRFFKSANVRIGDKLKMLEKGSVNRVVACLTIIEVMPTYDMNFFEVDLTLNGSQVISRDIAEEVSVLLGGTGYADLFEEEKRASKHNYTKWMINMPMPFDGDIMLTNGDTISVETPEW